jgi:hypothetical protein
MGHCVLCHADIDRTWQFCPFCGADNRPSDRRMSVPAHAHDFSKGRYCPICGETDVSSASKQSTGGLARKPKLTQVLIGCFLLFFSFLPLWLGLSAIITKHAYHLGSFNEKFGAEAVLAGLPFVLVGSVQALIGLGLVFLSPAGWLKFLDVINPSGNPYLKSQRGQTGPTLSQANPTPVVPTPNSGILVHCVQCHQQIDSICQFCPHCGADNRAPEKRPPVPAHTHNFSQGNHCLVCGASNIEEQRLPPAHGMAYRDYPVMSSLIVGGIALIIFGAIYVSNSSNQRNFGVGLLVTGPILILLGALFRQLVMVDLDRREVRRVIGFWPLPFVWATPFSDCESVVVAVQTSSGRDSTTFFLVCVELESGRRIKLTDYAFSKLAVAEGTRVANAIGLPLKNEAVGSYF